MRSPKRNYLCFRARLLLLVLVEALIGLGGLSLFSCPDNLAAQPHGHRDHANCRFESSFTLASKPAGLDCVPYFFKYLEAARVGGECVAPESELRSESDSESAFDVVLLSALCTLHGRLASHGPPWRRGASGPRRRCQLPLSSRPCARAAANRRSSRRSSSSQRALKSCREAQPQIMLRPRGQPQPRHCARRDRSTPSRC